MDTTMQFIFQIKTRHKITVCHLQVQTVHKQWNYTSTLMKTHCSFVDKITLVVIWHHQTEEGCIDLLWQYDALQQYVTKKTAFGRHIALNTSSKNNLMINCQLA